MSLDDLIISDSYDQEQLERIVSPYIRFSSSDLTIRFLRPWFQLNAEKKILMFLVAEKTRSLLADKLLQRTVPLTPQLIADELHIPDGTVRPKLKKLREEGVVSVSADSSYSFLLIMLPEVEKMFTVGGDV